ncbi:hypothetical protein [Cellulomonas sp. ICMP 17802]|uniref:hypothetical protein n=1 Tax=Cellulomonas sp. ICMP 17802 TaxID=3239199 RepID=UPI00351B631C
MVNASLGVPGGPTLPLGTTVEVESYVLATVDLTEAAGSDPDRTVDLLPDGGTVALLAIRAHDAKGKPADVTAELKAGAATASVEVSGSLLVASEDALAAIVATGPRTVVLTNAGTAAITVDVLAGHRA